MAHQSSCVALPSAWVNWAHKTCHVSAYLPKQDTPGCYAEKPGITTPSMPPIARSKTCVPARVAYYGMPPPVRLHYFLQGALQQGAIPLSLRRVREMAARGRLLVFATRLFPARVQRKTKEYIRLQCRTSLLRLSHAVRPKRPQLVLLANPSLARGCQESSSLLAGTRRSRSQHLLFWLPSSDP